jgi:hypothetical protein
VTGGGATVTQQTDVYGSFRVPSPDNIMGSRFGARAVIDLRANRLYRAGGSSNVIYVSIVWMYDLLTNQSAVLLGSTDVNTPGNYPPDIGVGELNAFGIPTYTSLSWMDPSGGFWYGFGSMTAGSCNGQKSAMEEKCDTP